MDFDVLRRLSDDQLRQLGAHAIAYVRPGESGWRLHYADGAVAMETGSPDEAIAAAEQSGFEVVSLH